MKFRVIIHPDTRHNGPYDVMIYVRQRPRFYGLIATIKLGNKKEAKAIKEKLES